MLSSFASVNANGLAFPVAATALSSFLLAMALVLTADSHGRFTMDAPGAIQKFHSRPTPRIGGVGIYLAILASSLLIADSAATGILATILLAGIPALAVGLIEDLTKGVSVRTRLLATIASGGLACWSSGVTLTHLNLPLLDSILSWAPAGFLFTMVAVGGVANALNIIDGFNGLASGTATIALLAIACIAALAGDAPLVLATVVIAAAVAGFWLVNFPWGKLFLGDGGAYFAGFALAWVAVLLPMRNPGVSPWASFMVCAYPIVEVIYSIVRRRQGRKPAGDADRRHLHSLVAVKVVQRHFSRLHPTLQNSAVSVIMWVCAALPAVAGIVYYQRTSVLVFLAGSGVLAYHFIYRALARS